MCICVYKTLTTDSYMVWLIIMKLLYMLVILKQKPHPHGVTCIGGSTSYKACFVSDNQGEIRCSVLNS